MRRRTGSGGDDLVEVELVDAAWTPAVEPGTGTSGDRTGDRTALLGPPDEVPPTPPAPAGPRRRVSRPAIAVVGLVAVVAVLANVDEARDHAARRDALAAVPGILTPITEPLVVSWEVPGTFHGSSGRDALLVSAEGATQALDPLTGAVLWSRPESDGQYCGPVGAAFAELEALWYTGALIDVPGPRLLGCSGWASIGYDGETSFDEVGMDVVDAGTGETLRRLATSGAVVLNEPFGTTAVLAVLTPAGHLTVQRWDPATGELLSEVTSERPVATGGSAIVRRTERFGDILVVNGDAEVAFDLATGEEVDPADALGAGRGWEQSVRLPDGATATWTWAETGPGRGQVVEPDGTVRFDLPGPPAQPSTSDDSVPDVLLVTQDDMSLTGLDATTGEELWTTELVGAQVVVLIDGRLVVRHGNKTIALDARDGTTLWTAETSSAGYHEGLTDGELLLTYVMGDGGSLELVALALEDGEELWRAPLPSGTQWLQGDPYGGVVGVTMASVFRLGDPGPWTPSDARG